MSSTRAHRRRAERRIRKEERGIDPNSDYGTVAAWCLDESDLPAARQQSHDTLIALMGDQRTGGVQWLQRTGDDATQLLGQLFEDATGEASDYYRRIGGHLREYGGWLVVAIAPGKEGGTWMR